MGAFVGSATFKRKFSLSMLIMFVLVTLLSAVPAFANGTTNTGDVKIDISLASDRTQVQNIFKEINGGGTSATTDPVKVTTKDGTSKAMITMNSSGESITFHSAVYADAVPSDRREKLKLFMNKMQESNLSKQSQQAVVKRMSDSSPDVSRALIPLVMDSTQADLYGAMRVLNPFLPFIRLVFGIGAFCIFLLLMASSIVDLMFIGIPIAREGMQNRSQEKGGKVPFLSTEAMSVVQEVEGSAGSSGSYRNPYLLYFKRRALTYIILSVCVLYLVVGELGGLVGWLLELASGTTISGS